MKRKTCIVSFVFFLTLLCVYSSVDLVSASKVSTEKTLETMMSTTIHDTSSHRRRSIQERGAIGPVDVCAGPNWNMRKRDRSSPCPKLVVWVPKNEGFTEFVKVNENSEVEGGFSIAIFCYAVSLLPYRVQPNFKAFINAKGESNGTYDELLRHIKGENISEHRCEAVAGDVTIRGYRAEYVSFTIPYLSAEVYMLVRGAQDWNQTLWTFLKPFTTRLWLALVVACFINGAALAILEMGERNPEFASPFYMKLVMVMWFPISTIFFHEGRILNNCSKVVLVLWLSMIFIVFQIFTATLSSWLTLDQLHPRLPSTYENVGYQDRSFLKELIIQEYNCSSKNLRPLTTIEEYKNALSNGTVNVIFDELPYIQLFLAKYGSQYMKFGPIKEESGIAFAFPLGSPLLEDFSRAVVNVTENKTMMDMKKKYLGFTDPKISQPNQGLPQSIDIQSFIGLFVFMGIVIVAAIIYSEIAIALKKAKVGVGEGKKEEQDAISVENFAMFMTIAAMISSQMHLTSTINKTGEDEEREELQVRATIT